MSARAPLLQVDRGYLAIGLLAACASFVCLLAGIRGTGAFMFAAAAILLGPGFLVFRRLGVGPVNSVGLAAGANIALVMSVAEIEILARVWYPQATIGGLLAVSMVVQSVCLVRSSRVLTTAKAPSA